MKLKRIQKNAINAIDANNEVLRLLTDDGDSSSLSSARAKILEGTEVYKKHIG